MRSILVLADRRPGSDARVETAIQLARHARGHVTVLVDTPISRFITMEPMGGNYIIADAMELARAQDDEAAAAVKTRLIRDDVPFDIIRSEDDPVSALAGAARLADLVIISRSGGLVGDLALSSRAPVLALGDNTPLTLPVRRACIAWDGGDQAAAALRAAVPLLTSCQLVKVITVAEGSAAFPATDALRYLSRHDIHAEYEEHPREGTTEETLAAAAQQAHAELLVMGAYGRSRMREFLFGGVTAHFLREPTAPALLLAH